MTNRRINRLRERVALRLAPWLGPWFTPSDRGRSLALRVASLHRRSKP